jgi:eukaryotic-like serine/threonine-protein kinase
MIKKYALPTLLITCIIILLAACSGFSSEKTLNTNPAPTTTLCPAINTARAAIMPPPTQGQHPNLVYTGSDTNSDGILQRYDTVTHKTTDITRTPNADMIEAQLSPDGRWILYSILINSPRAHVELRLVRVDGQYQQTLFCQPLPTGNNSSQAGNFSWSPDEITVAVVGLAGKYSLPAIYTVDLTQGQVQLALESTIGPMVKDSYGSYPQYTEIYAPAKWLDSTHLYVQGVKQQGNQAEPNQDTIYLLDTGKGANQHNSDLQKVVSRPQVANGTITSPPEKVLCDFDNSADGSQLFVLSCSISNGYSAAPGIITVQPASGGAASTLLNSKSLAIRSIRVINAQTMLLLVNGYPNGISQNGIWKMNTDGTGLTRLTAYSNPSFCGVSYAPCASVSPDGSLYAMVQFSATADETLDYGSLNGGSVTKAVDLSGLYAYFVGWTNM